MKATTMNNGQARRLFGTGSTFRLLAIQLLLLALLTATMVTIQSGTASADTGSQTTCDSHIDFDCIETELGETPQTGHDTTTEQVPTNHHHDPDHGEDINTGASCNHGILGICIPA